MSNEINWFIFGVRKDSAGRLSMIKATPSLEKIEEYIMTKEDVVKLLEKGSNIYTSYKEFNKYIIGAKVLLVSSISSKGTNKFIMTQSNEEDKDNLDNLAKF